MYYMVTWQERQVVEISTQSYVFLSMRAALEGCYYCPGLSFNHICI